MLHSQLDVGAEHGSESASASICLQVNEHVGAVTNSPTQLSLRLRGVVSDK